MILLITDTSSFDNFLQLCGLLLLFCFILAITYFTTKFVSRVKLGQVKNSNFHVIETFKITQNKYLQLVQIGEHYIVISISKEHIQFITELKKDELIHFNEISKESQSFQEIFSFVNKRHNTKNKIDDKDQ